MGSCRLLHYRDSEFVKVDVSRLVDVTCTGETEHIIGEKIDLELEKIMVQLKYQKKSTLVSVVTGSASCNIGSTKKLAKK